MGLKIRIYKETLKKQPLKGGCFFTSFYKVFSVFSKFQIRILC